MKKVKNLLLLTLCLLLLVGTIAPTFDDSIIVPRGHYEFDVIKK